MKFDGRRYRPMGMLDLFDEAFDLYKKNLGLLLMIASLVYVPTVGIGTYLLMPAVHNLVTNMPSGFDGILSWLGPYFGMLAVIAPLVSFVSAVIVGALIVAVSARYLHEPITVREAFGRSLPVTPWTTVAILFYIVAVVAGYFCCVIPGMIVQAVCFPLQFIINVMLVERGTSLPKAISRSWDIVKGQGSQCLGGNLVLWSLWTVLMATTIIAIQAVAQLAVQVALPLLPLLAAHQSLATEIGTELAILVLLPFQVCFITILYFDLRIRKEGYDMEVLASSLGYPAVSLPAGARPGRPARKAAR